MLVKTKITKAKHSNEIIQKTTIYYLLGFIPVYKSVRIID